MTYPRTLHLTEDGVDIVVQRPTARAVATAARAAVGELTVADGDELRLQSFATPGRELQVVALAEWIARSLGMDEALGAYAGALAGRRGVPQ